MGRLREATDRKEKGILLSFAKDDGFASSDGNLESDCKSISDCL